jgi:hypothetical protein
MTEAGCSECGHAIDAHLTGFGCMEIIGWQGAEPSGAEPGAASGPQPKAGSQLGLNFDVRPGAPILCGCLRGREGRTNAEEATKENGE